MICVSCRSRNVSVYPAEINIHHPGREGIDMPTVWAFPLLSVCLDCGLTQFTLLGDQLCQLEPDSLSDAAAA
jgi:hypothetical protein